MFILFFLINFMPALVYLLNLGFGVDPQRRLGFQFVLDLLYLLELRIGVGLWGDFIVFGVLVGIFYSYLHWI